MRTFGLVQAKLKFSELVARASKGETLGIRRRGKLTALLVPAPPEPTLREIFADIERIRRRVKPLKKTTIKELIEFGRE